MAFGIVADVNGFVGDSDVSFRFAGDVEPAVNIQGELLPVIDSSGVVPLAVVDVDCSIDGAPSAAGDDSARTGEFERIFVGASLESPGAVTLCDYGLPFFIEFVDFYPGGYCYAIGDIKVIAVDYFDIVIAVELESAAEFSCGPERCACELAVPVVSRSICDGIAGAFVEFPVCDECAGIETPNVAGCCRAVGLDLVDSPVVDSSSLK